MPKQKEDLKKVKQPRTSLVFRDEEQSRKFDVALAEGGLAQNDAIQSMIDELTDNTKHFMVILERVKKAQG